MGEPKTEKSTDSLKQEWIDLIYRLSPNADREKIEIAFALLELNYTDLKREYHTFGHIGDMLSLVDSHEDKLLRPDMLRLATWLHDGVYNTNAKDNEEMSAVAAVLMLTQLGISDEDAYLVSEYIIATKSHKISNEWENDTDLKYFLDFDMAILGSHIERYMEYAQGIAFEYLLYADPKAYGNGRTQFLNGVLYGGHIFYTPEMQLLEDQAKNINIPWEIEYIKETYLK